MPTINIEADISVETLVKATEQLSRRTFKVPFPCWRSVPTGCAQRFGK